MLKPMPYPREPRERKELSPEKKRQNRRYLLLLALNTLLFFMLYRILLAYAELTDQTFGSFLLMVLYMALLLGFGLAYLIYNRFFYRNGVMPEQLPPEWTEEQKAAFLEDARIRVEKSKWMLTIIFPLIFTFFIDAVDLFIIDPFLRG
ncbi:MAG: hypothetical protein J6L87_06660 [Clostridia bacterium]|nr:hypothetical protein [Clostridia bacterium]